MSIISPDQTSDQIRAKLDHLRGTLYKNFQCIIDSDMILQQVEILIAEKINDFIYQYLKDWQVSNLVEIGEMIQKELAPTTTNGLTHPESPSMKEEPIKKSKGKKTQEKLN